MSPAGPLSAVAGISEVECDAFHDGCIVGETSPLSIALLSRMSESPKEPTMS